MRKYTGMFLLYVMHYSGVLWLWRFIHRKNISILMLHGVVSKDSSANWKPLWRRITSEWLDESLSLISGYYTFISFDEAVNMIRGDLPIKNYSLVLTFDDGYQNNYTHALPVLKKHNIPAIFFIATNYIDRCKPYWIDRLDYALQCVNANKRKFKIGGKITFFHGGNKEDLRQSYKNLCAAVKNQNRPDNEMLTELDGISKKLEKESGMNIQNIIHDDVWSSLMTWEQLNDATKHSITIGSHTANHTRFLHAGRDTIKKELELSKRRIEDKIGMQCLHFCYPGGSYTLENIKDVSSAGYVSSVTTDEGLNSKGSDLYLLKRLPFPYSGNKIKVLATISGFLSALS